MHPQNATIPATLERLKHSSFRSRFTLKASDREYIQKKGLAVVMEHAREMLKKRIVPASPVKDGRQTPLRGHPVFIAQHATALCCRGCLEKWHHIPKNRQLTDEELLYLLQVIFYWLQEQMNNAPPEATNGRYEQQELL